MEIIKPNDTGTQMYALFTEGLYVDQIEAINTSPLSGHSSDELYKDLLEHCSQLASRQQILTSSLKTEIDKTLTVDNGGYGYDVAPDPLAQSMQKLLAIGRSRQFFVSRTGLLGMAPPNIEPGDLICVLFGAAVPFVLRRTGSFYILIGEVYVSRGYMEGRAIDEMEAGTRSSEWFEIH